jgi:hypothetical protein
LATWLRRRWPYVAVAFVALSASSLHVATYTKLSPFDESRHLDYMVQIYDNGHLVKLGDMLGQTSMRIEACRGVDLATTDPPCNSLAFDPEFFRDKGYNNAVNNPPGYYLVDGAVAKAVTGLGIAQSPLDPARLMGGLWLAAGLVLALYAGELLGLPLVPLAAAAVIFAMAPDPLMMSATINPDGAAIFAGGLVLVVALLWERRRAPLWALGVVGAAVALLKSTNLIAVAIVVLWFLVQAYRQSRDAEPGLPDPREYVWACVALLGAALLVTGVWLEIASARATIDPLVLPSNKMFHRRELPVHSLWMTQNLFAFFPPMGAYRAPVIRTDPMQDFATVAGYVAIAGMVAAALRHALRDRLSTLAWWTIVVLVFGAPAFMLSTWFSNQVIFMPQARYALSAVPMIIVLVASLVRTRPARIGLGAVAVLSFVVTIATLAFG